MDEYISREATLKKLCYKCNNELSEEPCEPSDCFIIEAIRSLPSIDVVPVVRCGECVHQYRQDYGPLAGARFCNVWCMINGMGDDGFCNYGERKEGAD